ncbi:VOC family protein [Nocardioides sp. GXZ039]|uniref:VOC family protein n=1 Tax=Nocardioides sp. GXZ039 TaxID=3136018 RepID=UPI0030F47BF4
MTAPGIHHVAYACRDLPATTRFYEDLMGFPLVHTEVARGPQGGFFRHTFHDTGDGSCIAFFDLHEAGEREGWSSEISIGNKLPRWVNHVAFNVTADKVEEVRARMAEAGVEPYMEVDHDYLRSLYYIDPNGIMVELCVDTPGFEPDAEEAHRLLTATPDDVDHSQHKSMVSSKN